MLYAAELFEKIVVRFPGAGRIRRTSPGLADSKPFGAVYHGSLEGGRSVDVEAG